MKNKLCYILLGIFVSFSFINNVFAKTVVTAVVDNTTVASGTVVSVKVKLTSDVALSSCLFKVSTDDNIVFDSRSDANNWNVTSESTDGIAIKNNSISEDDLSSGKNVLELKYTVNGSGNVTIKTENCVNATTEEEITDIADASVDFTATEPVEDTSLSNISVTGGVLSPTFSSSVYSYTITNLSSPKFGLSITTSKSDYQDDIVVKNNDVVIDDLSNIVFNGDTQGFMPITVTVNGVTTYSLLVIYKQTELDNTLKSIKINGTELMLKAGKFDYEYIVDEDINSINVEAVLSDSENFKFSSSGNILGTGSFSIKDAVDVIIIVEPKSSELGAASLTYNIRVVKENSKEPEKPPVNSGNDSSSNNNSGNNNSSNNNVNNNPGTGDISMYLMLFILIVSLVGSMILYQKNLEGYK